MLLFLVVWSVLAVVSFAIIKLLFIVRPTGAFERTLMGTFRVITGVFMAVSWLSLWRKLARAYFSWAIKRRGIQLN